MTIKNRVSQHRFVVPIKKISYNEFWIWWGLILVAHIEGRNGTLWDKEEPEGYGKRSS